ncbi:peptidase S10 (plasmid) [Polymorphobacter sp. PAMC 29334]|uniref:S10 family peptidase n=1 Tax=Polymorphobacter sp. PAMC 29334 TaxID=2862331 RepID=UPI001C740E67|nr:peptidase S10 [Polymorphobacter sp. PAMC 29334]QYE37291.1 peptidase S10 [Polymorphobacter sp. PAMC 29334]
MVLVASLLLASAAAHADETPTTGKPADSDKATADAKFKESIASETEAGWARAPVTEAATTTSHVITAGGRVMKYQATAGTLTIRSEDAKPTASVFYVAYTLAGTAPGTRRPITFFYNGGPGSSSVWLHMGSFAPMRVQTGGPEYIHPAPYPFGPNPDTLLDKTDLVFIDAIGTGYSRPLGDATGKDFWGVDQDADAFTRAIMRYVTKNGRWNSPKFLFGESYGTTRSAAVAYQLQDRGMALNGVILLSSILNYGIEQSGYDQGYISYLPSYAATAWYHKRLANPPATVEAAVASARVFAAGPYAAALARGQTLSAADRDSIAGQMSALTGLSADFIKRANLRVDLDRFQKELLRDQRQTVGRFDSRYTGVDADAAGSSPDFDASDTAISGAFIATFSDYVIHELGYKTELPYRVSAYGLKGFDWDWKHKAAGGQYPQNNPNVAADLAAAMRTNPYLKVLSLNGYYDMATPFFATEYDLGHMMLEPAQQKNLSFQYYPSGHMIYLNPAALRQLHADLSAYYDDAVAAASSTVPSGTPAIATTGRAAHTPAPGSRKMNIP